MPRRAPAPGHPPLLPPGGHTLPELAAVLLLVGAALSMALPPAGRMLDRLAVRQARERAVGLVARARAEALLRGGARIVVTEDPPELVLEAGGTVLERLDADDLSGSALEIPGPVSRAVLPWDAVGVGRMTSRTLAFRRGDALSVLVVSAYGRVRRR